jgi:hypothetical protein
VGGRSQTNKKNKEDKVFTVKVLVEQPDGIQTYLFAAKSVSYDVLLAAEPVSGDDTVILGEVSENGEMLRLELYTQTKEDTLSVLYVYAFNASLYVMNGCGTTVDQAHCGSTHR